jgi:hypothetical protein
MEENDYADYLYPNRTETLCGQSSATRGRGDHCARSRRELTEAFPKLRQHLFKEDGQLRSFVNLYLGDEDVRHLQGWTRPLPSTPS